MFVPVHKKLLVILLDNPCDVPIDPSNPSTYDMLSDFIGEMSPIFSDDFM